MANDDRKRLHDMETALARAIGFKANPTWDEDDLTAIDAWIERQGEQYLTRAEAIKRLVAMALKAEGLSADRDN